MIKTKLKQYFNFEEFRAGQGEVIEAILNNKDVVALMPTGGGKSLCYQLPAIIKSGVTIVISPLISLMKDQVDSLNARGIKASYINSSLSYEEIDQIIYKLKQGEVKLLYLAPERLKQGPFLEVLTQITVDFVAIDEAHCVSSWGHDFRPDYMMIKGFIERFQKRPVVAAFTATATLEVRADIIKYLDLKDPQVIVRGFDRPNLTFLVRNNLTDGQRQEEALELVGQMEGSGIVYALTRKQAEAMADLLNQKGISSIAYHAGLENGIRSQVQEDFMEDKYKVIVATVAFGMGVNKADIRFVIHFGMPGSLENYYQEAGRAGRDGEPAQCILLKARRDKGLHCFFIKKSQEDLGNQGKSPLEISSFVDLKYRKLNAMLDYVESKRCRRKTILNYFNDPDVEKILSDCGGCDVCLGHDSEAKEVKVKRKRRPIIRSGANSGGVSDTVQQTVDFYTQDYTIDKIAKIREFGQRTIFGHLVDWYASGGDFRVEEFIDSDQHNQIEEVINSLGKIEKLRAIKDQLPKNISYEQIKIVLAKIERDKL